MKKDMGTSKHLPLSKWGWYDHSIWYLGKYEQTKLESKTRCVEAGDAHATEQLGLYPCSREPCWVLRREKCDSIGDD